MDFTEKQEPLVKDSWQGLKPNIPEIRLRFFTLLLDNAPAGRNIFSFLKYSDELHENNPKLKAHAIKVFKMTCDASQQFSFMRKERWRSLSPHSKFLGSVHVQKGVVDRQFEVVKQAFLKMLKEAIDEKWSAEMNEAWSKAYDQLAAAIMAEMKAQKIVAIAAVE